MRAPKKYRRNMLSWQATPKMEAPKCRTPWKRVYTKQAAKWAAKSARKQGIYVHPYECACKWWHTSSTRNHTISDYEVHNEATTGHPPDLHATERGGQEESRDTHGDRGEPAEHPLPPEEAD